TPTMNYPSDNITIAGESVLLNCTSTDIDNDAIHMGFYGDTTNPPTTLLQNTTATEYNWTGLVPQNNYWRCIASDNNNSISQYTTPRTINTVGLYNCSTGNATQALALNITFYAEINKTKFAKVNYKGTFTIWGSNRTINNTQAQVMINVSNVKYCISPANATIYTNAMIEYQKAGYDIRYHLLRNFTLSNTTEHLHLYSLDIALATGTTITVLDELDEPMSNVYIKVQRYDVGTDSYYLVDTGRTEDNGQDYLYLRHNDVWYRFILERNGEVIYTSNPMKGYS
ncbi:unnamed protein product, partial [marine sediment metagenome]